MLKTLTTAALMFIYRDVVAQTTADTLKKEVLPQQVLKILDKATAVDPTRHIYNEKTAAYTVICADMDMNLVDDTTAKYQAKYAFYKNNDVSDIFMAEKTRIISGANTTNTWQVSEQEPNGTWSNVPDGELAILAREGLDNMPYNFMANMPGCAVIEKQKLPDIAKTKPIYKSI